LYCIVFKYLYSAPQQPWVNRGAFGSISLSPLSGLGTGTVKVQTVVEL